MAVILSWYTYIQWKMPNLKEEASMKKFIGIIILFSLINLFSGVLYAQDAHIDDGQSMLGLSDEGLAILAEQFETEYLATQKARQIEERAEGATPTPYNIIGNLKLDIEFARMRMTTFSDTKTFSGQADAGTQVGITVFSINALEEVQVNGQKSIEVGKSKLFNESINLSNIGDNYILIVSRDAQKQNVKYGVYNIVRLEEEKKVELENVKIDFFDNTPEASNTSFFEQLNQTR